MPDRCCRRRRRRLVLRWPCAALRGAAALLRLQAPVHPPPGARLPALEPDIMALGPDAALEHQREARRDQEDAARAGQGGDADAADDQQQAEREQAPFDLRKVEEPCPLFARPHHAYVHCGRVRRRRSRKACGACRQRASVVRRARGSLTSVALFGGRGLNGRDRRHRRLSRARGARRRGQVQLPRACRRSSSSGCPTRRWPKAASGCARRWRRSASRFRPSGSRSICRPPICPRKARITTCRSRSACWRRSARPSARRWPIMSWSANLSLDGRIAPSPGVLLAALHASALDKGLICPAAQGSRGGLGGRARRGRGARPARLAGASEGQRAGRRAPAPVEAEPPAAGPTWPRSRARRWPSARSRSPPRAATIC